MTDRWLTSESDLAQPVIDYLTDLKWDVYHAGDIADIIAVQGQLLWAIELKRSLSLEVIAQAALWHRDTHYSSVAVPATQRTSKGRELAKQVMDWKGVGLLIVEAPVPGEYGHPANVTSWRGGRLNRHALLADRIRATLRPEHKIYASAGNAQGRRWTPFQRTRREVITEVARSPGTSMKALIDAIDHHYASDAGARAHIADWIRRGVIKCVRLEREGRLLRLYPIAK